MKNKYKVGDIVYYFNPGIDENDCQINFIWELKIVGKIEDGEENVNSDIIIDDESTLLCEIVNIEEYRKNFNGRDDEEYGLFQMYNWNIFPTYDKAKEFAISLLKSQIEKKMNEKENLEKMLSKHLEK